MGDKPFNFVERTAVFGEDVIRYARKLPKDSITRPLISQLIRAGTSVGANFVEADEATTKKDFRYKVGICRKEAKEAAYWLRMIATAAPDHAEASRTLWTECRELQRILATMQSNSTKGDE